MTLAELVATHRPESHGRNEDWPGHARRLWRDERDYMAALAAHMTRLGAWPATPVIVDDGVVQDAHHRIVTALGLGWHDREIPVRPAAT